jgi:hypothetical protein
MDTETARDPFGPDFVHRLRMRQDGWTPDIMEQFIIELIEQGSVRGAAKAVDRHITSAYRLRTREPAFARAWDAARRLAYARLRDEAMERAIEGTPQPVWYKGEWIGMKQVRSDALLIALLNHLKHESPPNEFPQADVETVEDRRSDSVARRMDALALLPPTPPPKPVRLRPARGRLCQTVADPVALQ